ncbi:extracellular solute-binding protein [Beggiatoa leptomitoformis]|uniref:ABC transporter substrate-binding protein n=1 Tax=Beggiatoa leptomitoformis TaxID=288004 RepID=A0A2N9YG72_9GAMM|nr:extracellular solute-binding protein [Beggiatoa leptomitoformis]ALG68196.1 ABC transporter substrate-binding protein [Beggiatoa leptomitoformis]AUI69500.1 ABC transporter substrate-binding protein [Beggiatoa leptomitoformis]
MRISYFFFLLCCFYGQTALSASSAALGYTPKYPADFKNFDYVNPNAPKQGDIIISGFGTFNSLNPFLLKGIEALGTTQLLFDTLMVKSEDEPYSVYSLLAKDMQLSADKLSVTFHLNPDARFSDGSAVTAEDVKFSFETLKSDKAHPRYRIFWSDIVKADVIDKLTVKFSFSKENPELHLIVAYMIPIFSKKAVGDQHFDTLVTSPLLGSGAYTVADFQVGNFIVYKRNPNYWAKELNTRRGMFNMDTITVKYYKDLSIAMEAFKAKEFDFIAVYNSKEWARSYVGKPFDDGDILKEELPHSNNAGMQGFVFNLRKPVFQDQRVRQAINLAFDFEWENTNLFFNQYERCYSYFTNSELAAPQALPTDAELALLQTLQAQYPKDFPNNVLTHVWQNVNTTPPNSLRNNLQQASQLLTEAGWILKEGILQKEGLRLEFEFLVVQDGFDRIFTPFARNLERLGIKPVYRKVDLAVYQQLVETFSYDMIVTIFPQSQSPGNELMNLWHSSSADKNGTNNWIGLKNPVVDALLYKIIYAPDRAELVTATHALDRVLLQGDYVLPNWYTNVHRVAYWNKFGKPEKPPLYYQVSDWMLATWWVK